MTRLGELAHKLRTKSWQQIRDGVEYRYLSPLYSVVSTRLINRLDAALPSAPRDPSAPWAPLYRDGFVNLGNLGIDVDPFARLAKNAFDRIPPDSYPPTKPGELNVINIRNVMCMNDVPLQYLRHPVVNAAAREYLGDDTIVDQVRCSRIPADSSAAGVSGQWHHDRVGRRLVLWVLLHDVNATEGRPTWYARGTHHRTLAENSFASTRTTEAELKKHTRDEDFVPLTGKKGDAIFVDTHGFHRASFEKKAHHRDILFFEYSGLQKSRLLQMMVGFPIGAQRGLYPLDFDPTGTLFRKELFHREGDNLRYEGARDYLEGLFTIDGRTLSATARETPVASATT